MDVVTCQAERAGADFLGQVEDEEDEDCGREVPGRDRQDCSRRSAGGLRKRLVDGVFSLSLAAPVAEADDVTPPPPLSFLECGLGVRFCLLRLLPPHFAVDCCCHIGPAVGLSSGRELTAIRQRTAPFPRSCRAGGPLSPRLPPPPLRAGNSPGATIFVLNFVSIEWLWGGGGGGWGWCFFWGWWFFFNCE
jgi:hypothetical protein